MQRLYSSCVRSSMLHGSETWPVRKENEVALQRAEMRMVRWMCGVKLQDRVPSKELRGRLELEDIISVLQRNRLRWYGDVLRKEDNDWVKKCMEYEVEGTSRHSGLRNGPTYVALALWLNGPPCKWSGVEWRVSGQEVDQRKLVERLRKKTVEHVD